MSRALEWTHREGSGGPEQVGGPLGGSSSSPATATGSPSAMRFRSRRNKGRPRRGGRRRRRGRRWWADGVALGASFVSLRAAVTVSMPDVGPVGIVVTGVLRAQKGVELVVPLGIS
jgi:hypothetical protein